MNKKNARIRKFLADTADIARSLNRYRFGKSAEISVDFDSPVQGVEVPEYVTVDVYDCLTDRGMVFSVPVDQVEFYNDKNKGL
jgi:hypothetical protein